MSILKGLRLINSVEAGSTNSSTLESLLTADPGRKAELNSVLTMKGQAKRVANNELIMNTFANSDATTNILTTNPIAIGVLADSVTGITKLLSTNSGRQAFFNAKIQIGKGLDTIIADETSVNNDTLAAQSTFPLVIANSASTISTSTKVMNAISNSANARNMLINTSAEAGKQTICDSTINVAKLVEGELGGTPDTTTSLDVILNTNGRLTSILSNSFCKNVLTSGSAATAKFLAKATGLLPQDYSTFSQFYSDSTRWNNVVSNSTLKLSCIGSSYIRSALASSAFNKFSELVIASSISETKPYWNWARYSTGYQNHYLGSGYYYVEASGAWTHNGVHYIAQLVSGNVSTYGSLSQTHIWASNSTSSTPDVYKLNTSANGDAYMIRKLGNTLYFTNNSVATGSYYTTAPDLSATSWTTNTTGQTSYQIYSITANTAATMYVMATSGVLYYSATGQSNSWTAVTGTSGGYYYVDYVLGKFIAYSNSGAIWYSTSGSSWTNSTNTLQFGMSNYAAKSKTISNGTIALWFMGNRGPSYTEGGVSKYGLLYKSTTATDWTKVALPDNATNIYGAIYIDGLFYITTNTGMYSSLDANTWTAVSTKAGAHQTYFDYMDCTDKFVLGGQQSYYGRNIGWNQ